MKIWFILLGITDFFPKLWIAFKWLPDVLMGALPVSGYLQNSLVRTMPSLMIVVYYLIFLMFVEIFKSVKREAL